MFLPRHRQRRCNDAPPRRRSPLGLEVLEDRTLLSAAGPAQALDPAAYDPTRLLVEFRPGATPAARPGTTLGQKLPLVPGLYQVNLEANETVAQALAAYRADGRVSVAEPDYLLGTAAVPNDPLFGRQWDMQNTGQSGGKPGADVHAVGAWGVTTGNPAVVVGVLDTGIDYDHPDLYQNVWINQAEIPDQWYTRSGPTSKTYDKLVHKWQIKTATPGVITFRDLNNPVNAGLVWDNNGDHVIDAGDLLRPLSQGGWESGSTRDGDKAHPDDFFGWNFVANDNNPFDDNTHGSHVSGTIGAVGNNGVGVAGIDWNVQIMPVKFMDNTGTGTISDFIDALNYSVEHGARITNNSWAGAGDSITLYQAIANARSHGQIFVAAAGNNSRSNDQTPNYPSSFPLDNIVSVAASDRNDNIAAFSNYGAHSVDLAAPGVDILSTTPHNSYSVYSGTSMATPHVTGALALVWGLHPNWNYRQVIDQVLNTVDKLPGMAGKLVSGGRLDVAAAVGYTVPVPTVPKIVSSSATGPDAYSLDRIHVAFNEGIDVTTFTPGDVTLVGPGGKAIAVGVRVTPGTGNRQFDITFATQSAPGNYYLRIGPDVRDPAGHAMAQYQATFTISATRVFTTATPVSFTGSGLAVGVVNVTQDFPIAHLSVKVDISAASDGGLYVHLQAPDGTDIALLYRDGGSGQNFINTVLDDQATTPVAQGTAPFTGTYQPAVALSYLDGKDARGMWKLWVQSVAPGASGKLNGFYLTFTAAAPATAAGSSGDRVSIASVTAGPADPAGLPGAAPATSSDVSAGAVAGGRGTAVSASLFLMRVPAPTFQGPLPASVAVPPRATPPAGGAAPSPGQAFVVPVPARPTPASSLPTADGGGSESPDRLADASDPGAADEEAEQ